MKILSGYFDNAGEVSDENAWEHVYRCLLWMNEGARLAHIYDSNHMQKAGGFHLRAVRFTEKLCSIWNINRRELGGVIDILFKGCLEELSRQKKNSGPEDDDFLDSELETGLTIEIQNILKKGGMSDRDSKLSALIIEAKCRDYLALNNKRSNALGEGFEDLLEILLQKVANIPSEQIHTRTPVSKLPGFMKIAYREKGQRSVREPSPDIAITEQQVTRVITTAKWSIRQDRETQFQSEFHSFQSNKVQSTELQYVLITNEFDLARLGNVCRAIPTGVGGYVFHEIFHISIPMLRHVHGDRFSDIAGFVQTGKLRSLSDYLKKMRMQFGS
jgi:hypothetical protein